MQYFYDHQIRRYMAQFIRLFAGFSVHMSDDAFGDPVYQTVPVRYGDITRMVAHIIRNNSENTINSTPFISCYVDDLTAAPERRTYQQHKDTVHVFEKEWDEETQEYNPDKIGNRYDVERYQPVPYDLTMKVDIWTSNTNQKLQLLEQILVLFNPTLNINTTDNPLDWTSLSYVELTNMTWSTRNVPSGVDETIDVATLSFYIPIFISPPAKVRRQTLIHTIINNLYTANTGTVDEFDVEDPVGVSFAGHTVVTLGDYKLDFRDEVATLLNANGGTTDSEGNLLTWAGSLEAYGEIRPGISQLRFRLGTNLNIAEHEIVGTVDTLEGAPNKLHVTINPDSLIADTLGTIDAIIDPGKNGPGMGTLPAAAAGQSYLILGDMPIGGNVWVTNAEPKANDIVTYNGSEWIISFSASSNNGPEYTTNLQTSEQYEWTGSVWQNSYEGVFNHGFWRLYI